MERAKFDLNDFQLYQAAREFRNEVYNLIRQVPSEERYCLDNQMRRAAVSVTNNIAEGHGRWHYQENIHFCRISRGSISELLDDFNICIHQHYGDSKFASELGENGRVLIHRINSYIAYLKRCRQGTEEK